jgi:hypothetical protein
MMMFKLIKGSQWWVGSLIFFMPVLLIFFLGSQMAYGQVKGKYEAYQDIPEVSHLADLAAWPAGQVVMLQGRLAPIGPEPDRLGGLIVYQERPAEGRDARYQETFPLIFPEFSLVLADGAVPVQPSMTRARVIQNELHTMSHLDRRYTGFRAGDLVTVQGEWQPSKGMLAEATGLTSLNKAALMADWYLRFQQVSWARSGLGLLTLLGLILLVVEWRKSKKSAEVEAWPSPETPITPTTT